MTIDQPSMNEDASAQAVAFLCQHQSGADTLADVAPDNPNSFAPEPSWRLGNAMHHVNGGEM